MDDTCGNCFYFNEIIKKEFSGGFCKRYPPQILLDIDGELKDSTWPIVQSSDWCGEFMEDDAVSVN